MVLLVLLKWWATVVNLDFSLVFFFGQGAGRWYSPSWWGGMFEW